MAEKKNNGLGLPQTRGTFQFSGLVTGVDKNNFYTEKMTKTEKPFRMVNFGVQTDKENTHYVALNGMEREKVYFSKTETVDGKRKTEISEVRWAERNKFNKEGFRLIGINVGVTKTVDSKGKEVNDKKNLTEYDACKMIADNLKDDESIFVKGNIDYSHYTTDKGDTKRSVKFVPTQVSLCRPVDFEKEDFKETADFTQVIVFTGIRKEEEKFIVEAKIVNYNSIEDAEFTILNANLANSFRKNLKPYTSMKVWGNIVVEKDTTQVEATDCWGESNDMERINAPSIRELVITGADPNTIDKETYTEEAIENAINKVNANKRAENEFGGVSDDWGSPSDSGNANDDNPW
jgi:hypothetical protein